MTPTWKLFTPIAAVAALLAIGLGMPAIVRVPVVVAFIVVAPGMAVVAHLGVSRTRTRWTLAFALGAVVDMLVAEVFLFTVGLNPLPVAIVVGLGSTVLMALAPLRRSLRPAFRQVAYESASGFPRWTTSARPFRIEDVVVSIGPVGESDDSPVAPLVEVAAASAVAGPRLSGPRLSGPQLSEDELRDCVAHGTFVVEFQPVVDFVTDDVVGVEALVRCRRGDGSLAPPAEFLPLADTIGIIERIDRWVLEATCATGRGLIDRFGSRAPLVSCNVSPRLVTAPGFVDVVLASLRLYGLAPSQLGIDVNDLSSLADPAARRSLIRLRALGVHLAVDERLAGTGSLAALDQVPFSVVKLDPSQLDRHWGDPAGLRDIVAQAASRCATLQGKGVESEEQLSRMRSIGCQSHQGRLIAEPMALANVMTMIEREAA